LSRIRWSIACRQREEVLRTTYARPYARRAREALTVDPARGEHRARLRDAPASADEVDDVLDERLET
jgi:hypothetical protein